MSIKRIISIDWDFFIKEDPMLDMGHKEEMFFLNQLWVIRESQWAAHGHTPQQKMPMDETLPLVFTVVLTKRFKPPFRGWGVAESHAGIYDWAATVAEDGELEIINFDAHHDLGYATQNQELNCGNWAARLFDAGLLKNYTIVYPDWRKEHPETKSTKDLLQRIPIDKKYKSVNHIQRWHWSEWMEASKGLVDRKMEAMFICRSGCWTPPCYDDAFTEFCGYFGVKDTGIEPRKLRQEIEAMTIEMKKQHAALMEGAAK